MLSEGKLEELEKVARAATPGPWETTGASVTNWHDHTFEMEWSANGQENEDGTNANYRADAEHIAAFDPPTVLALISDFHALRAEVHELERCESVGECLMWKHRCEAAEAELAALRVQAPALDGLLNLPCEEQHCIASALAANIGYGLAPQPEHPDSPHAQAPAPVGGEVVEARNVAHGVLLEAVWEAVAWLGVGDTVAEEKLVPAILAADPDQAYARQALSELGFQVPGLSPDPTEGGEDE